MSLPSESAGALPVAWKLPGSIGLRRSSRSGSSAGEADVSRGGG